MSRTRKAHEPDTFRSLGRERTCESIIGCTFDEIRFPAVSLVPYATLELFGTSVLVLLMEHKDVTYEVVQTANPTGWKWLVYLASGRRKSGISFSRPMAIASAKHAIEKSLKERAKAKAES